MFLPLTRIISLIAGYKYWLLFPIAVIEGPIITVIGGFLSSAGVLSFWISYLVIVSGDVVGDALYYALGRFGGMPLISRYGRYININPERLEYVEQHFDAHGGKTLLFAKTQAWGSLILVSAGIIKMRFWKFISWNAAGTAVKTLILLLLGYYFGAFYNLINHYLGVAAAISAAVFVIGLLIYIFIIRPRTAKP